MNKFMRTIFSQDYFLCREVAEELAADLYFFFRSYLFQASRAYHLNLRYFPLIPKLHGVHEIGHGLKKQASVSQFCINPAVVSCAMDEDFIGRLAYVSRCVSPRIQARRTLERYLVHIQMVWARGG